MKFIKIFLLIVCILSAKEINLNFKNLDIKNFIKMVAKITHKNILLNGNINGKVNFIAVKPVNEKDLYNILLDILQSKGYTIVETPSGYLEVVTNDRAFKMAKMGKSDIPQVTTNIIHLNYISPSKAASQIKPFLSNLGKVVAPAEASFIVVTDFPINLEKIKYILKQIDVNTEQNKSKEVNFVKLKNMKASVLASKLNNIVSNLFNPKEYKIITDDNTNSLIIVTSDKNIYNKIVNYIRELDVKERKINQDALLKTKIVRLKNSDAKEVFKIIDLVVKKRFKKNPPIITLDETGNSIILIGKKYEVSVLGSLIKAVDKPKQQVFIKVRILEISNLKTQQIGTKLGIIGGSASNSGLYTFSANLGGPAIAIDNLSALGISVPTLKQGLALGATFDLLETTGAAKKLSEPSLLCLNNVPSTIYVGKTESVIVQSTVGANANDLTKNTYARQDIGLKLTVKPRIDIDNKVAINIKGVIEDILPGSQIGLPITSKREIDSTTIVKNGQSVIIGGLIKDNKDVTVDKVPLLGDIPILGQLFKHNKVTKDQTTLVIALTPYIVKNPSQLDALRAALVKLNELEKSFVRKVLKNAKKK